MRSTNDPRVEVTVDSGIVMKYYLRAQRSLKPNYNCYLTNDSVLIQPAELAKIWLRARF